MGSRVRVPAAPRRARRRTLPAAVAVAPHAVAVAASAAALLWFLDRLPERVEWPVVVVGAGAWVVAWTSDRAGRRAAGTVAALVVAAGAVAAVLWLGGDFRDLTLGAVWAAAVTAAAGLCGALTRVSVVEGATVTLLPGDSPGRDFPGSDLRLRHCREGRGGAGAHRRGVGAARVR